MTRAIPLKRQIVVSIDDWCEEPFEAVDNQYFQQQISEVFEPYDVQVNKVEIIDEPTKLTEP